MITSLTDLSNLFLNFGVRPIQDATGACQCDCLLSMQLAHIFLSGWEEFEKISRLDISLQ